MTRAEWTVYCRGYYAALCAALAAMDLALRARDLFVNGKRRAARLAAVARRRFVEESHVGEWEQVGAVVDHAAEQLVERPACDEWNLVGAVTLCLAVADAEGQHARRDVETSVERDGIDTQRAAIPPR